jgi:hypothetical protein
MVDKYDCFDTDEKDIFPVSDYDYGIYHREIEDHEGRTEQEPVDAVALSDHAMHGSFFVSG